MRLVNHYDRDTKEFYLQGEANRNPLEPIESPDAYLLPAAAQWDDEHALPIASVNEAIIWNGTDFITTPDYRDIIYYNIVDGSEVTYELNESPDLLIVQETYPQALLDAQAIIDAEELRKNEIKQAGLTIIGAVFPAVSNLEMIKFYAEFFKSIDVSARTPTADFQMVIDVYTVAVAALADPLVHEVDVVWP